MTSLISCQAQMGSKHLHPHNVMIKRHGGYCHFFPLACVLTNRVCCDKSTYNNKATWIFIYFIGLRNKLLLIFEDSLYFKDSLFFQDSSLKNSLIFENSNAIYRGIVQVHVELKNRLFLENSLFLERNIFDISYFWETRKRTNSHAWVAL